METTTQLVNFTTLLDYLYNRFLISFLICMIVIIIREYTNNSLIKKEHSTIPITRILCSSILATVLACALIEYIHMTFSLYIVFCILSGVWSDKILKIITNNMVVKIFFKNFLSLITSKEVSEAMDKTIDEIEKIEEQGLDESKDETIEEESFTHKSEQ